MLSTRLADPARAGEIALMEEFGLAEFTELTGIGVSSYGIYRVSAEGVSIDPEHKLGDFSAAEQLQIQRATLRLGLRFPCAPVLFLTWYEATCGEPHEGGRQSDFPLAEGFVEALQKADGLATAVRKNAVTSPKIIASFRVKPDDG
jgi:hypothetical protein